MVDATDPGGRFALPTGTVTFLLSDVEGSTRRWEDAPAAMAVAVPRHYALLDEAIAGHGRVRPVEQGEGDSVVAAFSRASDAVAAAVDMQRALAAEAWPEGADIRVRVAIHTGEAQLRDSGNYFGQSVIRCARLRAVGHGGQVLVSDVSAGLSAGRLPEGADLIELGVYRLRDLGRSERVWQLTAPGLRVEFPPLRSLEVFRHNLPVQVTPLIGRDGETQEILRRFDDDRLITLTGSGGVGKTRLALAVAAEVLERFPGGVWLVELAGVAHGEGVVAAALAALGTSKAAGTDLVAQVSAQLGRQPSLMVLDNCEHLIEACAEFVTTLLAVNGAVSVLATSREPLAVPGEVSWRVPSLETPPAEPTQAVAALSQYDAVRLFIDRARRARPSFAVTDSNAPAVAQICSRLDGIPLALELAAARCRQLSVERIAHDLDDRFRLLTGGARTVLPRHQTLAASIQWSFSRLDADEALTFRRIGVFVGPFPLEAAEAVVASYDDVDSVAVFDTISRLVDKSLVAVDDDPCGEPRYRLLETLRAYALNEAGAAGELAELRRAHAAWCLSWLDERSSVLHTDAMVDQVEQLHDNLKAALDWSVDQPLVGLRLLRLLARPWQNSGRPGEVVVPVDRLLTDQNARDYPDEWANAVNASAVLVGTASGFEAAAPLLQAAERIAGEIGDQFALTVSRWLQFFTPELSVTLMDLSRQRGDRYAEALAIIALANTNVLADPSAAAAQLDTDEFVRATQESSYLGDFANRVRALAALGTGALATCIELCRKLSSSRSTLMVDSAVYTLTRAALLCADEDELSFSADIADRQLRSTPGTAGTAELAVNRLKLLRGGTSTVDPELRLDGTMLGPIDLYVSSREAIDAGAAELAVATVRAHSKPNPFSQTVLAAIEAAVDGSEDRWHDTLQTAAYHGLRLLVADGLEGLAVAAGRAESWAECLRLAGAAQRVRDECNYRWRFRFEQNAMDEAINAARSQLDAVIAEAAGADGRGLAWPDAVRYARRARGERKRPLHGWASLTPTEHQVVDLVAEGLTNPQIAQRLIVGRATVKTHLDHIFAKLGINSRTELAARAARRGT